MSVEPIAVFCADTHLADGSWAHRPICGDAYYSLEQIIEEAVKLSVPIVGAGDLLDKHRNASNPIYNLHGLLDCLDDAGLPFHFIQGQHEMDDTPWLSSHSSTNHLHGEIIQLGPFEVYGLDYTAAGDLQHALDDIPEGTDILVAHQVWSDFMGEVASPQGGSHDIPTVHTMFTGDWHEYEEITTRGKDGQELLIISPGSTCMQSIDEPPDKYFSVLFDDGTFQRRSLDTRQLIDWSLILTQDDMEYLAENVQKEIAAGVDRAKAVGLPEKLHKPIIRITYSHRMSDVRRRALKLIGDTAHIFWKEKPPEKEEAEERRSQRRDGQKHSTTLLSKLPAYLKDQEKTRLEAPCQRLLQAEDVTAELRRMREEAFSDE